MLPDQAQSGPGIGPPWSGDFAVAGFPKREAGKYKWRSEARARFQAKIYFHPTGSAVGDPTPVHPVFPALFAFFGGDSSGFYSLNGPKLPA